MGAVDSVLLREAKKKAQEIEDTLTATDFQWQHRVYMEHDDGTVLDFNYAFLREEDDWYYIFTEHHGFFVFHKDDVVYYKAYVLND